MIMRKIGLIALLFVGLSSCGGSDEMEVGFKTTLKMNDVFEGGKVAVGEIVKATFVIENTGTYPLVLSDVRPSCGCTLADWSQDPILPGEKGYVKASVNTETFTTGPFRKRVSILANTTPAGHDVYISATVIK